MNTIDITVPQTVGVPLEPIVEAVRQALNPMTDETDLSTAVLRGLEEHSSVVKALATEVVDETDFSSTILSEFENFFDIHDHCDEIETMVEGWFDYNFSIDNYSDDVQGIVETVLSDRGWDNLDPSEFPTIARVAELEERVRVLEETVRVFLNALTAAANTLTQ